MILILIAIPFFISLDTYKDIIAEQVKKNIDRELRIDGKISLNLLPIPEITLNQVSLSSIPQAKSKDLFKAKSVSGKLEITPLLRGKVIISNISLNNPTINLEVLPNGKATWEFEKERTITHTNKTTENHDVNTKDSDKEIPLMINNIRIRDGFLYYIEGKSRASIQNLDIDMDIKALKNIGQMKSDKPTAKKTSNQHWSNENIDLSILNLANANLKLGAKSIKSNDLICKNLSIKSELKNGILSIDSFSGELFKGKFTGSANISAKNHQALKFNLNLKDIHLHKILPSEHGIKITRGIINSDIKLQSSGSSQYSYIKNLKGEVRFHSNDGVITGIDLNQLVNSLRKPKNIDSLALGLSKSIGRGQTKFEKLESNASINNGIIDITQGELLADSVSAELKGKMNLENLSLDIMTKSKIMINDMPPIKIYFYGPIDDPKHKIDVKAIWGHLIKNSLTGAIKDLKKGKINPQDLLKGLFK